jgi:hypothetical protein
MSKKHKTPAEKPAKQPKVNPELQGFDITINSFGEIIGTHSIEQINQFLNRHVKDKKLKDRDDQPEDAREDQPE